jgi:hypothetical protein
MMKLMQLTKQNKQRLLSLGTFTALSLTLLGCSKPSVVGKWQGTQSVQSPMGNQSLSFTTEYKADGTFSQNATVANMNIGAKGTYKVDGDKVTSSVTSVDAPPMIKAMAEPALKKQINQTVSFKVEGDNLTFTGKGPSETLTMTRVKE